MEVGISSAETKEGPGSDDHHHKLPVCVRYIHPETRQRRTATAFIPPEQTSVSLDKSFEYIKEDQLTKALCNEEGIDLKNYQIFIANTFDTGEGEEYLNLQEDPELVSNGIPLSLARLPKGKFCSSSSADSRIVDGVGFAGELKLYLDVKLVEKEQPAESEAKSVPLLGKEGRAWIFGRDWNSTSHFRPCHLRGLTVVDVSCSASHFLALTSALFITLIS